jgi:hypothetical protein
MYLRILDKAATVGDNTPMGLLTSAETKTQDISSKLTENTAGYDPMELL